tara:strand:- start:496 stop:660 length:165 start_codon:yes stop_codon:yes gene_type:complete
MPRGVKKQRHKITEDLILQLYKESKNMTETEKEKVVEKLKDLVKYIGKEMVVDL